MGIHPRIEHQLDNLQSPAEFTFEQFIRDMEQLDGQRAETTASRGDEGVDVLATSSDIKETEYAIQAKYSMEEPQEYGSGVVQTYGRLLLHHDCAAIYTNGYFTDGARKIAQKDGLMLLNREQLADRVSSLNAQPVLQKYYDRPTPTSVDEMNAIIDTLGRMERESTRDDGVIDHFSQTVPDWKLDTPARASKKNRLPLYCDAIRGLFEFGFLTEADLPIPLTTTGLSTRYLLNTEPVHSDGSPMTEEHREIQPGIYLNHHDTYKEKNDRLEMLAQYCVAKHQGEADQVFGSLPDEQQA